MFLDAPLGCTPPGQRRRWRPRGTNASSGSPSSSAKPPSSCRPCPVGRVTPCAPRAAPETGGGSGTPVGIRRRAEDCPPYRWPDKRHNPLKGNDQFPRSSKTSSKENRRTSNNCHSNQNDHDKHRPASWANRSNSSAGRRSFGRLRPATGPAGLSGSRSALDAGCWDVGRSLFPGPRPDRESSRPGAMRDRPHEVAGLNRQTPLSQEKRKTNRWPPRVIGCTGVQLNNMLGILA